LLEEKYQSSINTVRISTCNIKKLKRKSGGVKCMTIVVYLSSCNKEKKKK
jgi:hypothetical protein